MSLPAEIEQYLKGLKIGQGRHAGSSFCVLPWQSDFLRGGFGQADDAALSMARGCGKTTFLAGIMASAIDVDGPLVQPMADCVMVASVVSIRAASHSGTYSTSCSRASRNILADSESRTAPTAQRSRIGLQERGLWCWDRTPAVCMALLLNFYLLDEISHSGL